MSTVYNYDEYDFKNNDIKNVIFTLNNIKLLENPTKISYDNKDYTLLKLICNKSLKIFFKNIEIFLKNKIHINFDINTNLDYYELKLNKYIEQINNSLNNSENYDIEISINTKNELWKLHSVEISNNIFNIINNEDLDLLEEDPDYTDLIDNLLNNINKKKYIIKNKINDLSINRKQLENLYNKINNNFNITEFQNYEKELDLIN
jgi:hypothetical protein